ncbi:MAG: type VI secretion system tube protein Hcp, partial [Actinomycetota bacterium]|nr:type VI secretion system tube protein Hcp [Actinomycetota bacterium]
TSPTLLLDVANGKHLNGATLTINGGGGTATVTLADVTVSQVEQQAPSPGGNPALETVKFNFGTVAEHVDSNFADTGAAAVVGQMALPGQPAVPLTNLDWSATNSDTAGGGSGGGAGKVTFSDVSVTKALDVQSPTLFDDAASGRALPSVGVTTTTSGLTLTNARVTSYSLSDDGTAGGGPAETVTFDFAKFQETVGNVVAGWDVTTNAPF